MSVGQVAVPELLGLAAGLAQGAFRPRFGSGALLNGGLEQVQLRVDLFEMLVLRVQSVLDCIEPGGCCIHCFNVLLHDCLSVHKPYLIPLGIMVKKVT